MLKTTRRGFPIGTSAAAGAALTGTTGYADTSQPYDLVIRGGDVINPSQSCAAFATSAFAMDRSRPPPILRLQAIGSAMAQA